MNLQVGVEGIPAPQKSVEQKPRMCAVPLFYLRLAVSGFVFGVLGLSAGCRV